VSPRILIAYYSMTGNTRRIAILLRDALGAHTADLEEVIETHPRRGLFGTVRAVIDSLFGRAPSIRPLSRRPEDYSLLVLGTPIWANRLAGPMRTCARTLGTRAHRVAFFSTAGSSDGARAFAELDAACQRAPICTLSLTATQLASTAADDNVKHFARRLLEENASVAPRSATRA
jgi:flavodoxin